MEVSNIKIHFDGSVSHVKEEFPETEFHMRTENIQELKDAFIKFISNTFDMAITSDAEEIKEKTRENRRLQRAYFENMTNGILNKYYDLQVFKNPYEIDLSLHNIRYNPAKVHKYVRLVNVNGMGTGQVHFITDDGSYLLLPWCYIISMVPSMDQGE